MGGRVLRIITRLNRGGPLRQLEALVPRLPAYGWDGPVLVGRVESHEPDGTEDLERLGVEIEHVPLLRRPIDPVADGKALRHLVRRIRAVDPDVVHTHLGKAGALGRQAAAWTRVPCVHTFHGHHLRAPWPWDAASRHLERMLGTITTRAIALTGRQRRDLVQTHRVLPAEKVVVIGPGIDVDAVRRRAAASRVDRLRSRLVPPDEMLLVWAGRMVGVKDPILLVEALKRSADGFRLALLGEGPLRARVRNRIDAAGIRDRVLLPGPVPDASPWIAASDGVVLASKSEGASILVLEAKALARPAIVPAVGGLPDIVEHGVDGLWVPPGDADALAAAMSRLARDRDLRDRLGHAASRAVEGRFGAARLARATAALYEEVRRR